MNPRYVLAVCGLIMLLVNLVADKGGMLDTLASGTPPAAAPAPQIALQGEAPGRAGSSPAASFASGSDLGIGAYGAHGDEGYEPAPLAPATEVASSAAGGSWSRPSGALTDEQLGVEKPTGFPSLSFAGA